MAMFFSSTYCMEKWFKDAYPELKSTTKSRLKPNCNISCSTRDCAKITLCFLTEVALSLTPLILKIA